MSTITEIQEAIDKLPAKERSALAAWLRSQDQPRMSEREEAALLASLDKAATELDAGRGVPVERVREMVGHGLQSSFRVLNRRTRSHRLRKANHQCMKEDGFYG